MRRLLALLAVLTLTGCGAEAPAEKADAPVRQVTATSSPDAGVSTAAPTKPYLIRRRLHAGGQELAGRYDGLTVRGEAWLARRHAGGFAWGVGATRHVLPGNSQTALSSNGHYLVTMPDEGCRDDAVKPGGNTCVVRFMETSGTQPNRRLVFQTEHAQPVGVTDDGVVVLLEYAGGRWRERLWHAAAGARGLVPLRVSAQLQTWAMRYWQPGEFGNAGFELGAGTPSERWLGTISDGELRLRHTIPEWVEPGPGGRWVVGNSWAQRADPVTSTLRARKVGNRGKLGAPVLLAAPSGWSFAPASSPGVVFWEDADTVLARVVDSRQGGDRLARCDLPLATCVLLSS